MNANILMLNKCQQTFIYAQRLKISFPFVCHFSSSLNGADPWVGFSDVDDDNVHVWLTGNNVEDGYTNWATGKYLPWLCLFFFCFGRHIHMYYFGATGTPVYRFLVTSPLGFKVREGQMTKSVGSEEN